MLTLRCTRNAKIHFKFPNVIALNFFIEIKKNGNNVKSTKSDRDDEENLLTDKTVPGKLFSQ